MISSPILGTRKARKPSRTQLACLLDLWRKAVASGGSNEQ